MNYCHFKIESFCSHVWGDHRCPQTLAEICRSMGICCGFRAVAGRGKYLGFILLGNHKNKTYTSGFCYKVHRSIPNITVMDDLDCFTVNLHSTGNLPAIRVVHENVSLHRKMADTATGRRVHGALQSNPAPMQCLVSHDLYLDWPMIHVITSTNWRSCLIPKLTVSQPPTMGTISQSVHELKIQIL